MLKGRQQEGGIVDTSEQQRSQQEAVTDYSALLPQNISIFHVHLEVSDKSIFQSHRWKKVKKGFWDGMRQAGHHTSVLFYCQCAIQNGYKTVL